jgi:hypothetical protein
VETSKKAKDILLVRRVDPNTIVLDAKKPITVLALSRNFDNRAPFRTSVLDGIADEVLEELLQVHGVRGQPRHFGGFYVRVSFGYRAA